MSAVINTKQKNLGIDYLKRTAGYISGAVGSYISDAMPTTTSTLSEAKKTVSDVNSTFTHTAQSIMPKVRELKRQIGFKNISDWFNQKEDEFDTNNFSDADMAFDIDVDDVAAEAQITELAETGNQISQAIIESGHKTVEAQMEATANLTTSVSSLTSVVSAGFDQTNKLLGKMLEVLTKNTSTLIEATVASNSQTNPEQDMISSGRFRLSDYKKIVSSNIKNSELGMVAPLLPMLLNPDMIKGSLTPQELIKSGLGFGISKASPNFKKNLEALDNAINDTIMDSLIRLGENRDFGKGGMLGKLFGLDSSRKETDTSRAKLELKSIHYDTISKEAVTNAIPGYLRQILVTLGGPDMVYDYRSRNFKTKNAIKKEFLEASAGSGQIWNASDHVRSRLGTSRFDQMSYDLMINDLSSKTSHGRGRRQVDRFRNYQDAEDYVLNILYGGQLSSEQDIAAAKTFAAGLSRIDPSKLHDITNQVARNNVNRSKRMAQYVRNAEQYNVDLSGLRDSASDTDQVIREIYGRGDIGSKKSGDTAELSRGKPDLFSTKDLSGVNYTNIALYEIYRKLNDGINVFKTGESKKLGRTPYQVYGDERLPRPKNYKPRMSGSSPPSNEGSTIINGAPRDPDDPNLLRNQTLEDGTEENLSRGARFSRWGKKRGGDLAHAIFSGDPDQVRGAFGAIVGDVGQVAGDGIKEGISKINDSFGNISGYLKHKMFGTEYTYTDKDENGNSVTKIVEKNEDGGLFGFVKNKFTSAFDDAKEKGSKWFKTVSGYFDYGDNDDPSEVRSKRKRLINASIGAFAGAGILGGPMGLIMGALAGNALSASGISKKIKGMLFGRDKNGKAKGLFTRVGDSIVDPIRYQVGKSVEHVGNILKKNILGPLSDIGAAIHDRITSTASSTFGKVFTTIGNIILTPFKGIGKALISAAKLPITLAGNLFRGITGIESGTAGGIMNLTASMIAGKSTHKIRHEDGTVEEISTREWLKQRRRDRAEDVKQSKSASKYSDYKTWKAGAHANDSKDIEALKRAMSETVRDYDPEKDGTAEIKEDTSEIRDATTKQAEDTAEIKGSVSEMAKEALTEGSLFTHDKGLHDRVDEIIDLLGSSKSNRNTDSNGKSNTQQLAAIPSGFKNDRLRMKEENAAYGSALFTSGATLADEGGIDDHDVNTLEKMASGMDGSETKGSMFQRFKHLLSRNKDKADKETAVIKQEKESFLSKLIGGIGDVAGSLLSKGWPLILGGLTLFSDKFRDLLFGEDGLLRKAGSWLLENLPNIIKTAWTGIKEAAEDVNREIENQATGSTTVVDPVTGEKKSVTSAEQHAEDINRGVLQSAFKNTMNTPRLLKDVGVMSLERAGIRVGATAVQGGASAVSAAGGLGNIAAKTFQSGSAFIQGIKAGGFNKGVDFAGRAWALGGSSTAQTVQQSGAAVAQGAGGFKSMMGKMTNLKTWINPKAIGNIAGGIASDISAGLGWESAEIAKNKNIVGDYGLGNAGGFVRTSSTVKTITTTTIGVAGGIAIGQAVAAASAAISAAGGLAAVGSANFWNPAGWCALIIAGVLVASAGIAALINLLVGIATDKADKDYAVRSNAAKLSAVIKGSIEYKNGADNPMYVYCAQESDRVLGLTKGLNVKDPDLMFGKFLRQIADGLTSSPGTEVLLYDLLNNMAVQGVPFAVRVAGDSKEAKCGGDNANKNSVGEPPADRTGYMGGKYCTVKKSTVKKYIDEVYGDIANNVGRQDKNAVFVEDNVDYVYDAGKEVVKKLKGHGILSDDGKVQTKKFKGSPGDKNNADGWNELDEICRDEGSYFLTKCLVYINSKIEANKQGQQWLEERKDDVVKMLDGLKDFFIKEGESKVQQMRDSGMTDEEIESELKSSADPKGNQATPAADTTVAESAILKSVSRTTGLSGTDKKKIGTELSYITAAYAYSHPEYLEKWVSKNQKKSGVNVDYVNQIKNWKNAFNGDKRQQKSLRSQMITASLNFAEDAGDIFGLLDKFDWSSGGKVLGHKKISTYGAAFPLRGLNWKGDPKKEGDSVLDEVFNSSDPSKYTPLDVHKKLFGKEDHGKASESKTTSGQDATTVGSGQLAQVADAIYSYGSSAGKELTSGENYYGWRNALLKIPAWAPPNLPPVGGPTTEEDDIWARNSKSEEERSGASTIKEGGNPLNKAFSISSKYGWRVLDKGKEFHSGIDMYPTDGSQQAEVGARFNGTVKAVRNDVSYSGLNTPKGYSAGNYVTYETDSGLTIKNFHLKQGSIPSNIKPGERVKVGDKLGDMGTTGRSTGPHLHYQIESPSASKNPKGEHTVDPTSSINGGTTMSSFNSYGYTYDSNGSSIITGTDGSTDNSGLTGLAAFIEMVKNAGSAFLNKITGGLFGNANANNTSMINTSGMESGVSTTSSIFYAGSKVNDVEEFLNIARKEIGTKENPSGSNNVKYNTWYYGKAVSGNDYPWCMAFVQWCFDQAGLPIQYKTAGCGALLDWYKKNSPDKLIERNGNVKPGDIFLFNNHTHTGIVEKVSGDKITTIEGNTSSDDKGSQANGGCVARKVRERSKIMNFIRVVDFESLKRSAQSLSGAGEGAEALWSFLKGMGYNDIAIAGILGCWQNESALRAKRIEGDYRPNFPGYEAMMNDQSVMDRWVREGLHKTPENNPGYFIGNHAYPGIGFAQWTRTRTKGLVDYAKSVGRSWFDPAAQLGYFQQELSNNYYRKSRPEELNKAGSVDAATRQFCSNFEGYNGSSGIARRQATAKQLYNSYAGKIMSLVPSDATGGSSEIAYPDFNNQEAKPVGGPIIGDQDKIDFDGIDANMGKGGPIGSDESGTNSEIVAANYIKANTRSTPTVNRSNSSFIGGSSGMKMQPSFEVPKPEATEYPLAAGTGDGTVDLSGIINLLQQLLVQLSTIGANTGTANSLLESLNSKDFKDQGLRDSLGKLKNVPKNHSYARHSGQLSAGNARAIAAMARP